MRGCHVPVSVALALVGLLVAMACKLTVVGSFTAVHLFSPQKLHRVLSIT